MNVDELPAGRELDALVAEKVMGHPPAPPWPKEEPEWRSVDAKGKGNSAMPAWYWEITGWRFCGPCYSTDIAAAWKVWEKITANKPWQWAIYFESDEKVLVEYYPDGYSGNREKNCGSSAITGLPAPLAICRAALKAVGA